MATKVPSNLDIAQAHTLEPIADIAERENFGSPAVAVIGNVVREREKINWFEKRPNCINWDIRSVKPGLLVT